MNFSAFIQSLEPAPQTFVRFALPSGDLIPSHAHVTEVAHITKRFIDCGGTFREESSCRLQTWVADDLDHRLTAGKLVAILRKATPLLKDTDLPVEVEHDVGFVTQFVVREVTQGQEIVVHLEGRHTACLAPELCCPPSAQPTLLSLGRKGDLK